MSQGNNVNWSTLERITSPDLNLSETMGFAAATDQAFSALTSGYRYLGIGAVAHDRSKVVAGFEKDPNVDVNNGIRLEVPGSVWSNGANLPAPPSGDAGFRSLLYFGDGYAGAPTPSTVDISVAPEASGFRWYIVAARVVRQQSIGSRDIYNTGLGLFQPQSVVITNKYTYEIGTVAGTLNVDALPWVTPYTSEWVPLYAFRNPSTATAITADLVWDLRLTPADVSRSGFHTPWDRGAVDFSIADSVNITLKTSRPVVVDGVPLCPEYTGALANIPGASGISNNSFGYLYVTHWHGLPAAKTDGSTGRGVLVMSSVAPTRVAGSGIYEHSGVWVNSNTIPMPAFFAQGYSPSSIPLWGAVCIGAVYKSSGFGGYCPMEQVGGHVSVFPYMYPNAGHSLSGTPYTFTWTLPTMARAADTQLDFTWNDTAGGRGIIGVTVTQPIGTHDYYVLVGRTSAGDWTGAPIVERRLAGLGGFTCDVTYNITNAIIGGGTLNSISCNAAVRGWEW